MTDRSIFTPDELDYLISVSGGDAPYSIRPGGSFTGQGLIALRFKLESMRRGIARQPETRQE